MHEMVQLREHAVQWVPGSAAWVALADMAEIEDAAAIKEPRRCRLRWQLRLWRLQCRSVPCVLCFAE